MQLVEVASGPLERAFGLATVTLKTASAGDQRHHPRPRPGRGRPAARPADRAGRGARLRAVSTPAAPGPPPPSAEAEHPDVTAGPPVAPPAVPLSDLAPGSPAAAPVVPGAPVVKQTERPHPLTPFIRGWIVLVAIVVDVGPRARSPTRPRRRLRRLGPRDRCCRRARPRRPARRRRSGFAQLVLHPLRHRRRGAAARDRRDLQELQAGRRSSGCSRSTSSSRSRRGSSGWPSCGSRSAPATARSGCATSAGPRPPGCATTCWSAPTAAAGVADDRRPGPAGRARFTDRGVADRPLVTVSPQRLVAQLPALDRVLGHRRLDHRAARRHQRGRRVTAYALPGLHPAAGRAPLADQPAGDRDVQLHPGRVPARPAGHPRPDQPDQPVGPGGPDPGRADQPAAAVEALRLVAGRRRHRRLRRPATGENNAGPRPPACCCPSPAGSRSTGSRSTGCCPGSTSRRRAAPVAAAGRAGVAWFDFWTLRYGCDDRVIVTEHGWLTTIATSCRTPRPSRSASSRVRCSAGCGWPTCTSTPPRVRSTPSPASSTPYAARELALSQLDRARAAARPPTRAPAALRSRPAPTSGRGEADACSRRSAPAATGCSAAARRAEVFALDDAPGAAPLPVQPRGAAARRPASCGALPAWSGVDVGIEVP